MERRRSVDWPALILGILFILVSLLSFSDPVGDLISLVIFFAIFAIIKGVYELIARNALKNLTGYKAFFPIIIGVVDIIVGIYLLFNLNIGVAVLPFVFAIWFIIDSVFSLFTLDLAKTFSRGYFWFALIMNILGIILGFMLLSNPLVSALTLGFLVGVYLMIFGITQIIYAFR